MLNVTNVGMNYSSDDQNSFIIRNITLEVQDGECLAVVGGSGTGKTTFLNIIGGLLKPTEGQVLLNGIDVRNSHDIAIILQDYGLFPWKTVTKNIMLPMVLKHRKDSETRCKQILEKLELEKVKDSYPNQLSGGQKQRVAIGRAILSFPKMILMDEPFSALDSVLRSRLNRELKEYFSANKIITVIVTHSVQEAAFWGDKIMMIADNKNVEVLSNGNRDNAIESVEDIKNILSCYNTKGSMNA